MPVWGWVLIAVAAAILIVIAGLSMAARRRSTHLRSRFGPEYDRTLDRAASKREAESELVERERRREHLDIRPLSADSLDRYTRSWERVPNDFVDSPATAVAQADSLVTEIMRERGYPMDDFEQRAADISVDHPAVVERYREGHRIAVAAARGSASTEEMRQAMQHYRELIYELLEPAADEPLSADRRDLPLRSGGTHS